MNGRGHSKWYAYKRDWQLYVFLAVPLAYLIIFKYVPMYYAQIAFRNYTIAKGVWGSEWVGMANFIKFFNSYQCRRVLTNTLVLSLYTLLASFPLPVLLALGLNSLTSAKYRKFVQTISYAPHFISTVVLVGMLITLCNPRIGLYGAVYHLFTGDYPNDILGNAAIFPHLYVWSGVWQEMGWNSIVYLAALSSVDMQLHEAAMIDGASRFKRVIHIDLPAIKPTIVILLILRCGQIANVGFEKVFLMQNSLNKSASQVISTYVYEVGIVSGMSGFSYASAIDLFNSVVNCIMLLLVNQIARALGESSLW